MAESSGVTSSNQAGCPDENPRLAPSLVLDIQSPRHLLRAVVDVAVHATERAWSPAMHTILRGWFGDDKWRSKCREVLLQPGCTTASRLPETRSENFDLNTLAVIFSGLQRLAARKVFEAEAAGTGEGGLTAIYRSVLLRKNEYFQHMDALDVDDRCKWAEHLVNIVYSFRQRWAHGDNSISPMECLDAMLAIRELWPVISQVAGECGMAARDEKWRSALENAIGNLKEMCHRSESDSVLEKVCFQCTKELTCKIVASQALLLMSDGLRYTLQCNSDDEEASLDERGQLPPGRHNPWLTPGKANGPLAGKNELSKKLERILNCVKHWPGEETSHQTREERDLLIQEDIRAALAWMAQLRTVVFHTGSISLKAVRQAIQCGQNLLELVGGIGNKLALDVMLGRLSSIAQVQDRAINVVLELQGKSSNPAASPRIRSAAQHFIQQPRAKPQFACRLAELSRITSEVRYGQIVMIGGKKGSGKTAMAVEVAHKLRHKFALQFWIPASSFNLVQLALERCKFLLNQTHSVRAESPEHHEVHGRALLVMDGTCALDYLLNKEESSFLDKSAIVCAGLPESVPVQAAEKKLIRVHELHPLDIPQVLQCLQAIVSKYKRKPGEFAKFLFSRATITFLEEHMHQPMDIYPLVSLLRHGSSQHRCLSSVSMVTGNVSRFHGDGPEGHFMRSVFRLQADATVLLFALSFLGRRLASIPLWIFGGGEDCRNKHLELEDWQLLLVSSAEGFVQRRWEALQELWECKLIYTSQYSQTVAVSFIHQQLALTLFDKDDAGRATSRRTPSGMTGRRMGKTLLRILTESFLRMTSSCPPSLNHPIPTQASSLLLVGESLLLTATALEGKLKVKLCTWICRCLCIYFLDVESALEYYEQALACYSEGLRDERKAVLQVEYGMVLWRQGQLEAGAASLEEGVASLKQLEEETVRDPCGYGSHAKAVIVALATAELNCARYIKCSAEEEIPTNGAEMMPETSNPGYTLRRIVQPPPVSLLPHDLSSGFYSLPALAGSVLSSLLLLFQNGQYIDALDNLILIAVVYFEGPVNLDTFPVLWLLQTTVKKIVHICEFDALAFYLEVLHQLYCGVQSFFAQKHPQAGPKFLKVSVFGTTQYQ